MAFFPPFDPFIGGGPGGFFDPFYSYGYSPYAGAGGDRNVRRRLSDTGGGGAGEGAGATRAPFTVGSAGWTRSIPVDFIEREEEYIVRADIPGVHKDEIHVEVHDENVLRFGHNPKAEREKEDEEEAGVFHRAERVSTFRNRNLRMPDDADLEGGIRAKYEDGVLEIRVPKKEGVQRGPGKLVPIA